MDQIELTLSVENRSRRQIGNKLKELGLISKMEEVTRKPLKSGRGWQEDEESKLGELVEEHVGEDDRDGRGEHPLEARKQSSFTGRDDCALTPDGNTINLHRIKILTEKKTLLIKLLLENKSELEERMVSSSAHSEGNNESTLTCEGRSGIENTSSLSGTDPGWTSGSPQVL